ncbi:GFA family protein [Luteibacter yeojuensis]|uniref:GFA family protein n=1 Tax=Luteibacter yeojuensis TaxID=345309 RepID=UPI0018DD0250
MRCGICHCLDCRARSGAPFVVFVIFRHHQVRLVGERIGIPSRSGRREACARCGSALCWVDDVAGEIELYTGYFLQPGLYAPSYEVWTVRREPWMPSFGLPQFEHDRPLA